jgi:asparagine synthase (glutamine-hydrolysing)
VILKHLMRNKLPDSVLNRSKTGLDIPTHDWFRGPLRPLLEETLNPQAVQETGLFRPGAIQQIISDHMEGRANLGYHLWGLLILFLWIKEWKIQTTSLPAVEETQESLVTRPA